MFSEGHDCVHVRLGLLMQERLSKHVYREEHISRSWQQTHDSYSHQYITYNRTREWAPLTHVYIVILSRQLVYLAAQRLPMLEPWEAPITRICSLYAVLMSQCLQLLRLQACKLAAIVDGHFTVWGVGMLALAVVGCSTVGALVSTPASSAHESQ